MRDTSVVLEACDVLEKHNRTGVTVLKITCGKWYENLAINVVIESCRELIKENEFLKEQKSLLIKELKELHDLVDKKKE